MTSIFYFFTCVIFFSSLVQQLVWVCIGNRFILDKFGKKERRFNFCYIMIDIGFHIARYLIMGSRSRWQCHVFSFTIKLCFLQKWLYRRFIILLMFKIYDFVYSLARFSSFICFTEKQGLNAKYWNSKVHVKFGILWVYLQSVLWSTSCRWQSKMRFGGMKNHLSFTSLLYES